MTDALDALRKICLALPDAAEGIAWGHPVWRVGKAMFCGYEEVRDKWCVNAKLEEPHADLLRDDPRIVASQYLGGKRWVSLEAVAIDDWDEIADLVLESYGMSAPKRSLTTMRLRWVALTILVTAAISVGDSLLIIDVL